MVLAVIAVGFSSSSSYSFAAAATIMRTVAVAAADKIPYKNLRRGFPAEGFYYAHRDIHPVPV